LKISISNLKMLLAVAVAACIAGCSAFAPVKGATAAYVLDKVPADVPHVASRPVSVAVLAPQGAALFATRRMAYSTAPHQVGYFSESEWALPPQQLLQPLLIDTLRRTGAFSEVVTAPQAGQTTFVLRTELLELKQDFTTDPPVSRIVLRVALERSATGQRIAMRELTAAEPLREKNARAGVAAANDAMEKVLRALAEFVITNAN
jgi:cholesterol transport system auxiliary component